MPVAEILILLTSHTYYCIQVFYFSFGIIIHTASAVTSYLAQSGSTVSSSYLTQGWQNNNSAR